MSCHSQRSFPALSKHRHTTAAATAQECHGKLDIILSLFPFNSFAIVATCMWPITRHIPMLQRENITSSGMALLELAAFNRSCLLSVLYALICAHFHLLSHPLVYFCSCSWTYSHGHDFFYDSDCFLWTAYSDRLVFFYLYAGTRGRNRCQQESMGWSMTCLNCL
jgi:hypothetical protein